MEIGNRVALITGANGLVIDDAAAAAPVARARSEAEWRRAPGAERLPAARGLVLGLGLSVLLWVPLVAALLRV